ncbi:phage N-6-adenine-methyltransferase [Leminorella grimontii]|uniref:phage N-6-adenine-methyltransferase n=1 Tax=Leminorella grimontii TaxID=82981 RepID=UPI00207EC8AC|nr:phage N-6-adenine-methyltransferase [Leminorella grimontii]GKX61265.1 phage N-6-adenine-methyltransferase [Leminorella grimontii]
MIDFSETEYFQQINRQRKKKSHYLKDVGDQWCTPDALFWAIDALYGPLVLDLFSDGENSKCPYFYTIEDNALTKDWAAKLDEAKGAAFANPPYSRSKQYKGQYITGMSHIMRHTLEQRDKGGRYVYLVKVATAEEWWPAEQIDHVAFIRGRIPFELPKWFVAANNKQAVTTASFGIAVLVFDKAWQGSKISYLYRDDLLSMGNEIMKKRDNQQNERAEYPAWLIDKDISNGLVQTPSAICNQSILP